MSKIVIDTNVFVSALISRHGASFKLLSLIGTGEFSIALSVPLVLEYEHTAKQLSGTQIALSATEIDDVIDYLCLVAEHHKIYFLWRPMLQDPRDEMLLELAVSAACSYIITYNERDFRGIESFGIPVITPKTFLEIIGALP